jgi:hypothetical protein
MTKRVQLTITIGRQRLTLEGDFLQAEIHTVSEADAAAGATVAGAAKEKAMPPTVHHAASSLTEEQLIAEKGPRGHVEIVAVLAYSLQQSGIAEFTPEEIRRAYSRARQRPPKVIAQALRDAKNKYDFVEPGKKKGTFRLSPHGERTVMFDLPRTRSKDE